MVRNVILKLRCFKESAGFKTELQMKGTVKEKRKGVYETWEFIRKFIYMQFCIKVVV